MSKTENAVVLVGGLALAFLAYREWKKRKATGQATPGSNTNPTAPASAGSQGGSFFGGLLAAGKGLAGAVGLDDIFGKPGGITQGDAAKLSGVASPKPDEKGSSIFDSLEGFFEPKLE